MENSPLRFLDYDVSQKIKKDLRIVKEDYAREFHEKNFQDPLDDNAENHYLISDVITDLRYYMFSPEPDCARYRIYEDLSWTPLHVSDRIKFYNDHVELYKENIILQRCGYNY